MSKKILLSVLFLYSTSGIYAQKLSLGSTGVSFTKGTINTEVLTGIIQQKQEELKNRVFRNMVVHNFRNADASVKNFTTYYYIYSVMNTITTEKNKTIITRNLMQHCAEFAIVYGLMRYSIDQGLNTYADQATFYNELNKLFASSSAGRAGINTFNVEDIRSIPINGDDKIKGSEIQKLDPFKGRVFNFLIDMTFDAVINNPTIVADNIFKENFASTELYRWYNNDNEYQKMLAKGGAEAIAANKLRAEMDKVVAGFMVNYNDYKTLVKFMKNFSASEQGLTEMTEEQFLAMRAIIKEATEIIRLNYSNSIVSKVSDFLIDYTLIEKKEKTLSVDIESLISALDKHYNSKSRRSSMSSKYWYINPRPFFAIGVNYAAFPGTNSLTKDDAGRVQSLGNLYFASEKIGIKIKFFDRKYTRAFGPGERYKYKGISRVWIGPTEEKTISDFHFILYDSGLLYNIVNLKSDDDFNYAIAGGSLGLTFFNGLSVNAGVACPFTDRKFALENAYLNLGFDIPIIDYISALTKKN